MPTEKGSLLFCVFGFVLCGAGAVAANRIALGADFVGELGVLPWMLLFFLFAAFINAILKRARPQTNQYLFPTAAMLSAVGVVVIDSVNPALSAGQLRWLTIGMVVLLFSLRLTSFTEIFLRRKYVWAFLAFALIPLLTMFGAAAAGGHGAIALGPFRVNVAEFEKIFLIMFLTAHLMDADDKNENDALSLYFAAPLLAAMIPSASFIAAQHDIASALVTLGIATAMIHVASGRAAYTIFAAFATIAFFVGGSFGCDWIRASVDDWLQIWLNAAAEPHLSALAAGGVWGAGLTGTQTANIDDIHSLFVYAAAANETGLVGSLSVLMLCALFCHESLRVAFFGKTRENVLIAVGISAAFFLQMFCSVVGAARLLPLGEATLPFLSYGGSSTVVSFLMLGILLGLSRKTKSK